MWAAPGRLKRDKTPSLRSKFNRPKRMIMGRPPFRLTGGIPTTDFAERNLTEFEIK